MKIRNFEVLNSKAVKAIAESIRQQWNIEEKPAYGFLQKENDIFLVTQAVDRVNLEQLNINSLGIYFGELRHEQLRLSIEGSQMLGPKAKKNVIALDDGQLLQWLRGDDIPLTDMMTVKRSDNDGSDANAYLIIKHNNDFFGCGRIKEGKLLNFVPKSRRMAAL